MPSGQQMLLEKADKGQSDFRSQDELWRCENQKSLFKIFNQEGWQYHYSKGKLVAVLSPTGRILEFGWQARKLSSVRLRDSAGPGDIDVLQIAYNGDGNAIGLKLQGYAHEFAYREIERSQKLSAWDPPVGETAQFLYRPESGVLWKTGLGDPDKPKEIETFHTTFIDPVKNKFLENESRSERVPSNYWLKEDKVGKYEYGQKANGKDKNKTTIDPTSVTITHHSGLVERSSFANNRGVISTVRDGESRITYYYRAPGKPYDGKLRQIEVNNKTVLEYIYDRKTGLLAAVTDADGAMTYFDYDPKFRRVRGDAWEPKPLRVRRRKSGKTEIVAEYRYDEKGKVAAVKDRLGDLTQYTYNKRVEITAVKTPAGDLIQYDYDALGRQVSVTSGERSEKLAYNDNGRLASRLSADGTKTEILYDALGHQTQIKRNGEVIKELVRDEFQRVIGEKDALNRLSRTERDERGNLITEIAPNGAITRYEYDSSNRRTAQIDGNGNKISFEYNKDGRLVKQSNPIGGTQMWKYDPNSGKLLERSNGEQKIVHSYSAEGQLETIDYGRGDTIAYTRDDEGRILTAQSH